MLERAREDAKNGLLYFDSISPRHARLVVWRLLHYPRMREAWLSIDRHAPARYAPFLLLFRCIRIVERWIGTPQLTPAAYKKHYLHLAQCARDIVAAFTFANGTDMNLWPIAKDYEYREEKPLAQLIHGALGQTRAAASATALEMKAQGRTRQDIAATLRIRRREDVLGWRKIPERDRRNIASDIAMKVRLNYRDPYHMLSDMAVFLERIANAGPLSRKPKDAGAFRAYLMTDLSAYFREEFGRPLDSAVAAIAETLADMPTDEKNVRAVVNRRSPRRSP